MAALRYWVSACRRRKFARASPGGVRDACQEFRPSYQVHSSMRPVGALRSCWQNSPWGSPRVDIGGLEVLPRLEGQRRDLVHILVIHFEETEHVETLTGAWRILGGTHGGFEHTASLR